TRRRLEPGRAAAPEGLLGAERGGALPAAKADRGAGRRPTAAAVATPPPQPARAEPRSAPDGARVARERRRPGRTRLPEPPRDAPQADRPLRRLRLDGALLARDPPVRARLARERARGGGLCLRDAADQADRGALRRRSRPRARGGVEARGRLVGRNTDRRVAEGVQRPVGTAGPLAGSRRRGRLGRVGA